MKRYYCPQAITKKGYVDLPSLASSSMTKASEAARNFAEQHRVVVRVIRKAKGWSPSEVRDQTSLDQVGEQDRNDAGAAEETGLEMEPLPMLVFTDSPLPDHILVGMIQNGDEGAAECLASRYIRKGYSVQDRANLAITCWYMGWRNIICVLSRDPQVEFIVSNHAMATMEPCLKDLVNKNRTQIRMEEYRARFTL